MPTLRPPRIKVAITMGDPSGIGPIITSKAMHQLKGLADFTIIGDKWVFDKVHGPRSTVHNFKFIDLNNVSHKNFSFGKIKAEYGRASIEYLDKALALIKSKDIDCLVTCPICKESIKMGGFKFPGHTEYLAHSTHAEDFVMMLLNKDLKISLVTRHISLRDVPLKINPDRIRKTILLTHRSLKELFLIRNPRLVVCGLNPHASDNGLMGNEENRIIKPALKRLARKIKYLDGPLAADVAIVKARQKDYDCIIAMYHDQALIPLKILDALTGVNITLGLGFIRTSPLHGTAFDIAKNFSLANPHSLIEAIRLAARCTSNLRKV